MIEVTIKRREPWLTEPNRHEWTDKTTGLRCMIARHTSGHLCGYVSAVCTPPDTVDVHGGITSVGQEWIGFDCGHFGDFQPYGTGDQEGYIYRDFPFVVGECEKLAKALRSQQKREYWRSGKWMSEWRRLVPTMIVCMFLLWFWWWTWGPAK